MWGPQQYYMAGGMQYPMNPQMMYNMQMMQQQHNGYPMNPQMQGYNFQQQQQMPQQFVGQQPPAPPQPPQPPQKPQAPQQQQYQQQQKVEDMTRLSENRSGGGTESPDPATSFYNNFAEVDDSAFGFDSSSPTANGNTNNNADSNNYNNNYVNQTGQFPNPQMNYYQQQQMMMQQQYMMQQQQQPPQQQQYGNNMMGQGYNAPQVSNNNDSYNTGSSRNLKQNTMSNSNTYAKKQDDDDDEEEERAMCGPKNGQMSFRRQSSRANNGFTSTRGMDDVAEKPARNGSMYRASSRRQSLSRNESRRGSGTNHDGGRPQRANSIRRTSSLYGIDGKDLDNDDDDKKTHRRQSIGFNK